LVALLQVSEALERVLAGVEPLAAESMPLLEAYGRVLAEDVAALRTQPPADVSAMDGYAVRGGDIAEAPVRLRVIGEVAAGRPLTARVGVQEAARIFTGGVIPAGADTIVVQEHTEREGDMVVVTRPAAAGRNVRKKGLDFHEGDRLLLKGHRLSGRDLALAAAMNHPTLRAHRAPKIAMFATGDELVAPGADLKPGQIVYSNSFALAPLVRGEGAHLTDFGVVADRLDDTVAAIVRARRWGADILLTAGGASVGEYDLVQQALGNAGFELAFWRVALRPGRPMLFGRIGEMRVLGVPGNPVSSYVCAHLFLVPLIRRLAGRSDLSSVPEPAVLGSDLPANDERADYLRATLEVSGSGPPVAKPFSRQDSSMLASLAKADCLVVREPFAPAAPAGSPCSILKLGL
jgi:molybdopterin molybdotransferase